MIHFCYERRFTTHVVIVERVYLSILERGIPFIRSDARHEKFSMVRRDIRHDVLNRLTIFPRGNLCVSNIDFHRVNFASEWRLSRDEHF